jgi:Zn-dependent peptidase ImmA (M78 family)
MHSSQSESNNTEKEANRFAAEFLVPSDELARQIVTVLSIPVLSDLKRYWRVSMAMLMYHSKLNKIITERRYKSLIIEMGKRGFRRKEPTELLPPKETPKVVSTLILVHKRDLGYNDSEVAKILSLNEDEMKLRYYDERCYDDGYNDGRQKIKLVI